MHQAMATGLPRIVDELNAIVSDVAKKIELYPQAKRQMRRVLIELYTRIFGLFTRLMKWYASNNHRWKLTKKDCYNEFQQDLQGIRTWVDLVNKGAWNNLVLEMRHARDDHRESLEEEHRMQHRFRQDMLEAADKFYKSQQNAVMQQAIQQEQLALLGSVAYKESVAELVVEKFMQHFNSVGASQTGVLTSMMASRSPNCGHIAAHTGIGQLPDSNEGYRPTTQSFLEAVSGDNHVRELDSSALSLANKDVQSREDVERYSRPLDDWYPEGLTHPAQTSAVSTGRPALHESIAARIVAWVRGDGSQVLCIQLPYKQDQTSVGRDIASYVVSSAWEAGHPIISHFCLLPRTVAEDRSPQTVALCEMMLSITRQLVLLLPSTLPKTAVSLDEARFASLDGTLRTWDRMVALFTDLLSLVEQSLLIVISGLQRLDGRITTPLVENLLAVIRRRIEDPGRPTTQTVKVLFVTEGQARAVVPWLRPGEYSVYEGPQRSTRPGASV
jgi:vacuolar-type H+-ATPase subunit H